MKIHQVLETITRIDQKDQNPLCLVMDNRLKGSSLMVPNEDLDTTPNSEGSQLTKPSTADQHLSMLMEQGKAMVALLQSSVDEEKKDTDEG